MAAVRALIFDFNGTLSHDEPILCATYQAIFAEQGRPLSSGEYYAQLAGNTKEAIISTWLGVDDGALEELVGERIRRYLRAAALLGGGVEAGTLPDDRLSGADEIVDTIDLALVQRLLG